MLVNKSQLIRRECLGSVTLVWCHSWVWMGTTLPSCFLWVHGFEWARAMRSLICVPCFVFERGVRIPALMSWVLVSCRGLDTHTPCSVSYCEHAVSSSLVCVLFCPGVLFCVTVMNGSGDWPGREELLNKVLFWGGFAHKKYSSKIL